MKMTQGKQEQNDKMSCTDTNQVSHEGLQKFHSKLITKGLVSRWVFVHLLLVLDINSKAAER